MTEDEALAPGRIPRSWLALLFIVALLPRVCGLIAFANPDENWGASVRVLTGDLSGGTSQTLPLTNYLNAVSFVVLYAIGRLVGVWHSTADFRAQYFLDRTPFIFAGRLVSASLGALSAPAAILIANRLGLTRKASLIVGGVVGILPINVRLSQIAKPESGIAFAVLLLAWSLLRKLGSPDAKGSDAMVGVAAAIAVSFKQTALFVVAPAIVGLAVLLRWDCKLPWSKIARGLLVGLLVCVALWVPMNIGVLLDVARFLDYQRATMVVMTRNAPVDQIAGYVIPMLARNNDGLTAAGLLAWLFAPWVRRDRKFLLLWGSTAFGYLAFLASSRALIGPRYLLPFDELAFTLGCIAALSLAEREGRSKLAGVVLTVAIAASAMVGSAEIVKQALTTPMWVRCSEVVKAIAQPGRDRILTANLAFLRVPIDAEATDDDYRRHERLAKKYGVKLPERTGEKQAYRNQDSRVYYVRPFPFGYGGMETLDEAIAETAVKPFWWPIQPEEWELDHWTAQGFNIFIVADEAGPTIAPIPAYRSLYKQIKERCDQVAVFPSRRPIYGEGEVKIYRLRDRGGRDHPTSRVGQSQIQTTDH